MAKGIKLIGTALGEALNGGALDDDITSLLGTHTIMAGAGDDRIVVGDTSGNYIDAGTGNDNVIVGNGNNRIYGGDGNDDIKVGNGSSTLYGGTGNDRIAVGDGNNTIFGDDGSDAIRAGRGNNYIDSGAGNDDVDVGSGNSGGNNRIYAGTGNDKVAAGTGNDLLYGGEGNDQLFGGEGNNLADGGTGNDQIHTGDGNDTLYGGDGNDQLFGGEGNNIVHGGAGNDDLRTGRGNDVLDGGAGSDKLDAGGGNDLAIWRRADVGARDDDDYKGGGGVDTLRLAFTHDEWLTPAAAAAAIQTDIGRYRQFLSSQNYNKQGEADGKTFEFRAFELDAKQFEKLEVTVDGLLLSSTAQILGAGTGAVLEDNGHGLAGANIGAPPHAGGSLTALDLDAGQSTFQPALPAALVAGHGNFTFALNPSTGNWDWTYTLRNGDANVQSLQEGQVVHDTLLVKSLDGSATKTIDVAITGINDAPVNTVPGARTVNEDTNLAITGLSVSDVDAASSPMTTTLSVAHGTLAVAGVLGGAAVTGSGTGTVTLHGTRAEINASLAGNNVVYRGVQDFSGSDALTMVTDDGFHGGVGPDGVDTDQVAITVNAVADKPLLTYTIEAGASVNQVIVHVTATQADADGSEYIDRFQLGGLPPGVTVATGPLDPGGTPSVIHQDFVLTLPPHQDATFDFAITAVSKEPSNGSEATTTVQVPVVFDHTGHEITPSFVATDQSMWNSGNAFTFDDDRFLGFEFGDSASSNDIVGYSGSAYVKAGFQSDLHFQGGQVDANLNYDLHIDTDYNKSTDALLISSSKAFTGGDFQTEGPGGTYTLDFILNFDFSMNLTYNLGGDAYGNLFGTHIGPSNNTVNILSIDSVTAPGLNLGLPDPLGSLSIDIAWPNLTTDADPTGPPGHFTSSGASNNFLQLNADVDQMLADIFAGGADPFGFSVGDTILGGSFDLADLVVSAGLNFLQDFTLQEQNLTGVLHFENGATQAFSLGSDINVQHASQIDAAGNHDGNVDFFVTLDAHANLTNQTNLGVNLGYAFDLLKAEEHNPIPFVPNASIGPVFHVDDSFPVADVNVYNQTFGVDFTAQNFNFHA